MRSLRSLKSFDELTEKLRIIAFIEEGLDDARAGRVHAHADIVAEMKKRYRKPARRGSPSPPGRP
ncbi:hypothetical protein HPC49_07310 [Pyxidicoccus fallax]|uniref:Uncharacterized protein n=1 Tax=Pyxidicoccus fallax TaxID=394095 RepID=A0A848LGG7_9BACT|nr:hypothetical protein [Pyxidicoccus fallax]NMO15038.1 hypothetical protein [Pyxidicoccus fallax]NPC78060.1 hypothetical protein [Pyxidicoccus fallax]